MGACNFQAASFLFLVSMGRSELVKWAAEQLEREATSSAGWLRRGEMSSAGWSRRGEMSSAGWSRRGETSSAGWSRRESTEWLREGSTYQLNDLEEDQLQRPRNYEKDQFHCLSDWAEDRFHCLSNSEEDQFHCLGSQGKDRLHQLSNWEKDSGHRVGGEHCNLWRNTNASVTIDLEFVVATIIFIHSSQSEVHNFRHSQSRSSVSAPMSKTLPSVKEHKASEICPMSNWLHASRPGFQAPHPLIVDFSCHFSCLFCSLCSSGVESGSFLLAW